MLLLLTCCTLSAQSEKGRVRNIVLVHGAWADGSGGKGVNDILVKDGYKVSIVQEPEASFKEDVAATKRVLALQMDHAFLWLTVMAAPLSPKRERIHRLRDWYTSRPTCQMREKMRLMMEGVSEVTSANLLQ